MNYILKSIKEGQRLDEQTSIDEFSLSNELRFFKHKRRSHVLDVGCGSGVLCRYLDDTLKESGVSVSGCDISDASLGYAKSNSSKNINYFKHDFLKTKTTKSYDVIFNRYVGHHLSLEKYKLMLENFYNSLLPEGEVYIIDMDNLFVNIGSLSRKLRGDIDKISQSFDGNLQMGRYIPSLLNEAGFKDIKYNVDVVDFQGESKVMEISQWKQRFNSAILFYVDLFGDEMSANKFFKAYLSEVAHDYTPLFYNKFIVRAKK